MTNEEARDIIWSIMTNNTLETEVYEAFYKAQEALEKQIPKKPIWKEEVCQRGLMIAHCPNCDDDFNSNEYDLEWCWECGQHIDWSE